MTHLHIDRPTRHPPERFGRVAAAGDHGMSAIEIVAGRRAYAEHLDVKLGETTGVAAEAEESLTAIAAEAGKHQRGG